MLSTDAVQGRAASTVTAVRPGEVAAMQRGHIAEGWWQMPGKPQGDRRTKNSRDHRVRLSEPAQALVERHFAEKSSSKKLGLLLKGLVAELGIERVTPHDLRRTA